MLTFGSNPEKRPHGKAGCAIGRDGLLQEATKQHGSFCFSVVAPRGPYHQCIMGTSCMVTWFRSGDVQDVTVRSCFFLRHLEGKAREQGVCVGSAILRDERRDGLWTFKTNLL